MLLSMNSDTKDKDKGKGTMIPNVNNLHQERSVKEKARNDVFTLVLNKCIEKILYTNKNTDKTFIFFEVPKILIGFPFYDMKSCIIFIMQKLISENYKVNFIEPFYLYIDWGSAIKGNATPQISDKIKIQTKELLKKFPNTSTVVFEYTDKKDKRKK
jgi:hypothetical protein